MLQNIIQNKVLSLQCKNKENKKSFFKTWRTKKEEKIMKEKDLNKIAMLQYQIQRYQAAGKGSMCQHLNSMVRKLMVNAAN